MNSKIVKDIEKKQRSSEQKSEEDFLEDVFQPFVCDETIQITTIKLDSKKNEIV